MEAGAQSGVFVHIISLTKINAVQAGAHAKELQVLADNLAASGPPTEEVSFWFFLYQPSSPTCHCRLSSV